MLPYYVLISCFSFCFLLIEIAIARFTRPTELTPFNVFVTIPHYFSTSVKLLIVILKGKSTESKF